MIILLAIVSRITDYHENHMVCFIKLVLCRYLCCPATYYVLAVCKGLSHIQIFKKKDVKKRSIFLTSLGWTSDHHSTKIFKGNCELLLVFIITLKVQTYFIHYTGCSQYIFEFVNTSVI